ncbi:class I adenylate-forming enzyme family protein [Streptomyces sp. NPDC047315]|uniref:class I adenylate-forming enzyme family protein n=1 Tax=Streptomyces sp. NPDC047315 TaxID=3155142 RepID=UPI0033E1EEF9
MATARTALVELLRERAAALGDAPLVGDDTGSTGAGELVALVDTTVRTLRAHGVGPGELVGTVAWPPAAFIADVLATVAVGAVAVPLSHRCTPWQLARLQAQAPLVWLAAPDDSPLTLRSPVALRPGRTLSRGAGGPRPAFEAAATAQLTSGTTGSARLALRPAAALLAEAEHYRAALRLRPGAVLLSPVPLHHAYGFGLCALAAPLAGARLHCVDAGRPRVLLREVAAGDVTLFVGVPPLLRVLAKASRPGQHPRDARAVGFLSAGMALDEHTAASIATRLGGHVGEVYGTTETGPICVRAPRPWRSGTPTPGVPLPGVTVTLAPPADRGAGGGRSGLVTVVSPSMMLGYAQGGAIDDSPVLGGFTTGDLGRWEGDALVLQGRLSTCINVAGDKVSPEEVEAVLLAFPQVASCLVAGVADAVLGQRISATVTPDSVDLDALDRFCRERLSDSRVPHLYRAVAELATTETGKVIRPAPAGAPGSGT